MYLVTILYLFSYYTYFYLFNVFKSESDAIETGHGYY